MESRYQKIKRKKLWKIDFLAPFRLSFPAKAAVNALRSNSLNWR
jgi:hypothetical protein